VAVNDLEAAVGEFPGEDCARPTDLPESAPSSARR
jgi:hypothetical protein